MRNDRLHAPLVRGGVLVAFSVVLVLNVARWLPDSTPRTVGAPSTIDTTSTWHQTVLLYVADPRCPACADGAYQTRLRASVDEVRLAAQEAGYRFRAVAVSLSPDFEEGAAFLMASYPWDEVSLGGGWLNRNTARLLEDHAVPLTTPMVMITTEQVARSPSGQLLVKRAGRDMVYIGATEITRIVEHVSALLPADP